MDFESKKRRNHFNLVEKKTIWQNFNALFWCGKLAELTDGQLYHLQLDPQKVYARNSKRRYKQKLLDNKWYEGDGKYDWQILFWVEIDSFGDFFERCHLFIYLSNLKFAGRLLISHIFSRELLSKELGTFLTLASINSTEKKPPNNSQTSALSSLL